MKNVTIEYLSMVDRGLFYCYCCCSCVATNTFFLVSTENYSEKNGELQQNLCSNISINCIIALIHNTALHACFI